MDEVLADAKCKGLLRKEFPLGLKSRMQNAGMPEPEPLCREMLGLPLGSPRQSNR